MTNTKKTSTVLNIALWIAQLLLAATFIWAGAMKIFKPEELPWAWVKENPSLVTFTGIVDLLAGFGLVLPTLFRIQPKLTVYAAYGTILLMLVAIIFHVSRGEGSQIGFNIFCILLAGFVAWGRKK